MKVNCIFNSYFKLLYKLNLDFLVYIINLSFTKYMHILTNK